MESASPLLLNDEATRLRSAERALSIFCRSAESSFHFLCQLGEQGDAGNRIAPNQLAPGGQRGAVLACARARSLAFAGAARSNNTPNWLEYGSVVETAHEQF